ncbi:MAG TPA: FHA domain-containing protein [Polyangiaceae bacterium]|nr:FHA domain-containing protein [Polyangiaceae bacterium]
MWKLTIEDDQSNRTAVHLVRTSYGLGRGEDNAIRLTERNVSRRHARLNQEGQRWIVEDLSSYNGCFVNGQRVSGTQTLSHGDLIQLGDYRLVLEDESLSTGTQDITATVPAGPRAPSGTAAEDRLVMLMGPTPNAQFALSKNSMLIGRGEDCDISINHPSVSRVHAELHPVADGRYEIVDKGSANAVRVNGAELPRSLLDARDVVELGDVVLKFIPAGELYLPGLDDSQIVGLSGITEKPGPPDAPEKRSKPFWSRWGWFGGSALLLLGVVVVVRGRSDGPRDLVSIKDEATARAERILVEAKALMARGDLRAAQRKLSELPVDAPSRASSDFRTIQAAYADYLFTLADQTSEPREKRNLYNEIARSPSIDSARRSRAEEQLAQLSEPALNVADLPSARERPPAPPAASGENVAGGSALAARFAEPGQADAPAREATPPAATGSVNRPAVAVRPTTSAARPSGQRKSPNGVPTVIRDNPY